MGESVSLRVLCVCICLFLALPVSAAERVSDPKGGVSYVVPSGWKVIASADSPFAGIYQSENPKDQLRNIQIQEEPSGSLLDVSADNYVAKFRAVLPHYRLLRREAYRTKQGYRAIRLVHQHTLPRISVRQSGYLILTPSGRLFFVIGTVLSRDGGTYDILFDRFVDSFVVEE